MIVTFEDYTYELTEKERKQVRELYNDLEKRSKKGEWLKSSEYNIPRERFRKMAQHIRLTLGQLSTPNKPAKALIASSKGYLLTSDQKLIAKHIKSMKQRVREQQRTIRSTEKILADLQS